MLITKVSCPNCNTVLRPARPLPVGKKVKCPKCKTDFTAEADNGEQPADAKAAPAAAKPKAAKPPEPKPQPKKTDDDDEDSGGTYNIIAADRPKTQEDLDREAEERADDEDDPNKVDFVPDHSIKDLRGPAQLAVNRPSNLLIANGVIGFFGWIILFIIMILPVVFPDVSEEDDDGSGGGKDKPSIPALAIPDGLAALGNFHKSSGGTLPNVPPPAFSIPKPKDDKKPEKKLSLYMVYVWDLRVLTQYPWYLFVLFLTPIFFGIAYACVMTYGAVKMQNLESRTWGIVSSCMCMFPFATWGFVTLVSMVVSLVVFGLLEEQSSVLYCLIVFLSAETLGCIAIGVYGLMTMLSQDVINGFEYVPDE